MTDSSDEQKPREFWLKKCAPTVRNVCLPSSGTDYLVKKFDGLRGG